MFAPNTAELLSKSVVTMYETLVNQEGSSDQGRSCILIIVAKTAGSPIVRAVFELYKVVTDAGGELMVVDYPSAYSESLTGLGILALPGFSLAPNLEDAMSRLAQK